MLADPCPFSEWGVYVHRDRLARETDTTCVLAPSFSAAESASSICLAHVVADAHQAVHMCADPTCCHPGPSNPTVHVGRCSDSVVQSEVRNVCTQLAHAGGAVRVARETVAARAGA